MKRISLITFSLALMLMLTFFFQADQIYAQSTKYSLTELEGGGRTIIIGNNAYAKEYLEIYKNILSDALTTNQKIYIKLAEGIYIDKNGFLVEDSILDVIQIDKYYKTDVFEVISIY